MEVLRWKDHPFLSKLPLFYSKLKKKVGSIRLSILKGKVNFCWSFNLFFPLYYRSLLLFVRCVLTLGVLFLLFIPFGVQLWSNETPPPKIRYRFLPLGFWLGSLERLNLFCLEPQVPPFLLILNTSVYDHSTLDVFLYTSRGLTRGSQKPVYVYTSLLDSDFSL